ncbi:MAG: hypothetical protein M1829_006643 [Trizodia sp. TS-e1964]|nr:MAG: hypothetical protein M1829_006643 [Trizodia sp. TS-e1964]
MDPSALTNPQGVVIPDDIETSEINPENWVRRSRRAIIPNSTTNSEMPPPPKRLPHSASSTKNVSKKTKQLSNKKPSTTKRRRSIPQDGDSDLQLHDGVLLPSALDPTTSHKRVRSEGTTLSRKPAAVIPESEVSETSDSNIPHAANDTTETTLENPQFGSTNTSSESTNHNFPNETAISNSHVVPSTPSMSAISDFSSLPTTPGTPALGQMDLSFTGPHTQTNNFIQQTTVLQPIPPQTLKRTTRTTHEAINDLNRSLAISALNEAPPITADTPSRPQARGPNRAVRSSVRITSAALTTINALPRPPCYGNPEIWANGRQALCESLPYYRAYQSGSYSINNRIFATMIDKQAAPRDHFSEELVITRTGGGLVKDDNGEMVISDNSATSSKYADQFRESMDDFVPIVVIIGKGNVTCPTSVPHQYNVAAYFHITHVWSERVTGKAIFKVRLEKIKLHEKSWWAVEGSGLPIWPRETPQLDTALCEYCNKVSPVAFLVGWMCLHHECKQFWKINGEFVPENIDYDPIFLKSRKPWPSNIRLPFPLTRSHAMFQEAKIESTFSRISWKGFVCHRCGLCSSRIHWASWKCQNKECGYSKLVKHPILSVRDVMDPHVVGYPGHALPLDVILPPVTKTVRFLDNYRIHIYNVPRGGTVMHFLANDAINSRPGGPNDMFDEMQKSDIGLKRGTMSNSMLQGPMLTSHFAVNFGMPYKYIVDVESKSFKDAPRTILKALNRLTWAGQMAVTDGSFQKFNELLAVGYFEAQRMGYHDDGETTLGPTIASLSLGCSAKMYLRMKSKYYLAGSERGREGLEPLEGSYINLDSSARARANKANSSVAIDMILNHGDLIVMHGAGLQKYYEHAVEPSKQLRYALTSRYVIPNLIARDQWHKGEYIEHPGDIYDGDEGNFPPTNFQCPDLRSSLSNELALSRDVTRAHPLQLHRTHEDSMQIAEILNIAKANSTYGVSATHTGNYISSAGSSAWASTYHSQSSATESLHQVGWHQSTNSEYINGTFKHPASQPFPISSLTSSQQIEQGLRAMDSHQSTLQNGPESRASLNSCSYCHSSEHSFDQCSSKAR